MIRNLAVANVKNNRIFLIIKQIQTNVLVITQFVECLTYF